MINESMLMGTTIKYSLRQQERASSCWQLPWCQLHPRRGEAWRLCSRLSVAAGRSLQLKRTFVVSALWPAGLHLAALESFLWDGQEIHVASAAQHRLTHYPTGNIALIPLPDWQHSTDPITWLATQHWSHYLTGNMALIPLPDRQHSTYHLPNWQHNTNPIIHWQHNTIPITWLATQPWSHYLTGNSTDPITQMATQHWSRHILFVAGFLS